MGAVDELSQGDALHIAQRADATDHPVVDILIGGRARRHLLASICETRSRNAFTSSTSAGTIARDHRSFTHSSPHSFRAVRHGP